MQDLASGRLEEQLKSEPLPKRALRVATGSASPSRSPTKAKGTRTAQLSKEAAHHVKARSAPSRAGPASGSAPASDAVPGATSGAGAGAGGDAGAGAGAK